MFEMDTEYNETDLDEAAFPGGLPLPDTDFGPNQVSVGEVLVEMLHDDARQVARAQARMYRSVWQLAEASLHAGAGEFIADEVRAALMLTRRAAESIVNVAYGLCEDLPNVWEALSTGSIDAAQARVFVYTLQHLEADRSAAIADQVLDDAGSLTTGQLQARLAKLLVELDPADAEKRYEAGVEERRVQLSANPDGTANLHALSLPAQRAAALMRKIAHTSRRLPKDGRTADQKRADVFMDLLDGSPGSAKRAQVDIRVNLTTLLELDNKAGEFPGWGHVTADLARRVVAAQPDAEWRVTVDNGIGPIWTDITRRRPKVGLRRVVEAEIGRCVFPGCRMPAVDCDLDHIVEHSQGGPTTGPNLAPKCRHDHMAKAKGRWKVKREGSNFVWTSPLGIIYEVRPQGP